MKKPEFIESVGQLLESVKNDSISPEDFMYRINSMYGGFADFCRHGITRGKCHKCDDRRKRG
jgi:hypothetical protein